MLLIETQPIFRKNVPENTIQISPFRTHLITKLIDLLICIRNVFFWGFSEKAKQKGEGEIRKFQCLSSC